MGMFTSIGISADSSTAVDANRNVALLVIPFSPTRSTTFTAPHDNQTTIDVCDQRTPAALWTSGPLVPCKSSGPGVSWFARCSTHS
ncbi:hypothetical protein PISMIDRAFT_685515, partial [Pisolithus microcarpus 441]